MQESWGKEMETKPGGEGESGGGRTTVQGRGWEVAGRTGRLLVDSRRQPHLLGSSRHCSLCFSTHTAHLGPPFPASFPRLSSPTSLSSSSRRYKGSPPHVWRLSDMKITADLGAEHVCSGARLPGLKPRLCARSPVGVAETRPLFPSAE